MFRKLMSLFRKVDDVTTQTDRLNDLIYGRPEPSERDFLREKYGMSPRQCQKLGVMILKYHDDVLESSNIRRLQRLLDNDTKVFSYYLDFQQLTVMLILHFRSKSESQIAAISTP